MLRLSVTVDADEWVFGFPQDEVVIGSARGSSLVLDHPSVLKQHARLGVQDDKVFITHVGSAIVTVNGTSLLARRRLQDGDVVEIGAYRLALVTDEMPGQVEQGFLDAIARAPNDEAARVVYGDWLEENGRLDHAQFLRAQIELRRVGPDDAKFQVVSEQIRRLAPRISFAWRRAIAHARIENCNAHFDVQCPKTWDELAPTAKSDERWCKACKKNVHYANDLVSARRLAAKGECVSLDIVIPRRPDDLRPPVPIRMAGAIAFRPTR